MAEYHEPIELLDEKTRNISRALKSLKEEADAIDWYNQRISASNDPELKSILTHNRDEEIEHAVMVLEWLRRNMGRWDTELRKYLFKDGPIKEKDDYSIDENKRRSSLNIGDLR